jgi:hypothetical protein
MNTLTAQQELEAYMAMKGLDCEVDMIHCGNLEMVCRATLRALQNNTTTPMCIRVYSK